MFTACDSFEEYSGTQCFSDAMSPQQMVSNELKFRDILLQKGKHEFWENIIRDLNLKSIYNQYMGPIHGNLTMLFDFWKSRFPVNEMEALCIV